VFVGKVEEVLEVHNMDMDMEDTAGIAGVAFAVAEWVLAGKVVSMGTGIDMVAAVEV